MGGGWGIAALSLIVGIENVCATADFCKSVYGLVLAKAWLEAQSKDKVIVVRVCYFLQKNRKTNEFIVLQDAKRRFHGTVHLALSTVACAPPACHLRSREQYVLSRTDDE